MIRTKISLQAAPSEKKGAANGEIPPWVIAGMPSEDGGYATSEASKREGRSETEASSGRVVNVKPSNLGGLFAHTPQVNEVHGVQTIPPEPLTLPDPSPDFRLPSPDLPSESNNPLESRGQNQTTLETHPYSESQGLTIQEGKTPPWFIGLRTYYETMLASITGGKKDAGHPEMERVYALYLHEIRKELERRKAVGDRHGYAQAYRLWQTIRDALIVSMRLQVEDLVRRQFKGEAFAAAKFPAGDPPPEHRELFDRWEKNFGEVTRSLDETITRILRHDPTYTVALDWPPPDWFKDEGIPEGLWR